MRNKKTLTWIGILGCSLLIWLIYIYAFSNNDDTESLITTTVKKGKFESFIYSTGQLQAQNSVSINVPSELSARSINIYEIKITKLIEEGTVVDSGGYVASLDHSAVEEKMAEAMTDLAEKLEAYEDAKIDTSINLSNLRDDLISAKIDLEEKELILKQSIYESPAVIRQASLDVEKAKRKQEQDERNYVLKKQQDEIKVHRALLETNRVRTRVKEIEDLFEAIDIKAPGPGMLIYSFDRLGNKIKVGSSVTPWRPTIAELPDLTSMISKTFINEVDINKIKTGQKVKVGVDAFPEKELDGVVTEVANIGQVIPGGDAKVFEVTIKVNAYDQDLRPAMTTANVINTNTIEEVLFIPLEAVFSNDSLSYVYTSKNERTRSIIETGSENENYVVVKQGLAEGDIVLLNEPTSDKELPYTGIEIYKSILKQDSTRIQNTKIDKPARPEKQPLTHNAQ
jgi:multidrug efflux pump subunit AcrA (membrane-fusion protein)